MKPSVLTCLFIICLTSLGCIDFNSKGRAEAAKGNELNLWSENKKELEKLHTIPVDPAKTPSAPKNPE